MFNTKRLIWAICDRKAKFLHGWFNKEPNLLKAIAKKVVQCKNFEELKKLLIDFERIVSGETPSSDYIEKDIEFYEGKGGRSNFPSLPSSKRLISICTDFT